MCADDECQHDNGTAKEISLEDENGEKFSFFEYDGIAFPLEFTTSEADALKRFSYVEHFPYKAGDVLLCSYPKTGSHWVTNLLHYLMYDGDLDDLVSYPVCHIDFFDFEGEVQREGRRLLLSHFPPKHLPTEHFANGGKTILLFRNPKDTAVSMYHMMKYQKVISDYKLSWDCSVKYWLEGKTLLGSYFEYYNSWQKELNEKPSREILFIQYENLKMNTFKVVSRIQNYLGLNHSDERLQAVIDKCSLENLRTDVESGRVQTRLIDEKGKSILYRKGIIGDWKNHFTVAQNEMFETVVDKKMKNSIFNYKAWN